ncbi:endochitinase EP3-like [Hibiscus syriacus]|uniref:endochitinase EP3-like n=1 Tax=Hibiscus syriacus TaxID=106335 RepID=UPI00192331C5|nr:endochitinase EP3-like [Hibiscus syriacus]
MEPLKKLACVVATMAVVLAATVSQTATAARKPVGVSTSIRTKNSLADVFDAGLARKHGSLDCIIHYDFFLFQTKPCCDGCKCQGGLLTVVVVVVVVGLLVGSVSVKAQTVADIVTDEFFNGIIGQSDPGCEGRNFYSRAMMLFCTDFCSIEERAGPSFPNSQYCDPNNTQYPCNPNRSYYGRGPIQLSWNFNYGPAGVSIGFDGLNSPETVANDPLVSFKTALWYWVNFVQPVIGKGFGATTRAIIGAIECDGGNPATVQARINYCTQYCNQLGVDPGPNLSC